MKKKRRKKLNRNFKLKKSKAKLMKLEKLNRSREIA